MNVKATDHKSMIAPFQVMGRNRNLAPWERHLHVTPNRGSGNLQSVPGSRSTRKAAPVCHRRALSECPTILSECTVTDSETGGARIGMPRAGAGHLPLALCAGEGYGGGDMDKMPHFPAMFPSQIRVSHCHPVLGHAFACQIVSIQKDTRGRRSKDLRPRIFCGLHAVRRDWQPSCIRACRRGGHTQ